MKFQPYSILVLALAAVAMPAARAADEANPILAIARQKAITADYRAPYDKIRPEHVKPAIEALLAEAKQELDSLKASTGPRTWDNTMAALEDMGDTLSYGFGAVSLLESLATSPEQRKAFNEVLPMVSAFSSRVSLDPVLAGLVKSYSETPEAKKLTGARARLLKVTLDQFRRGGAYLDEEKRKRLFEINTEMSRLSAKFGQNALDSTNQFEVLVTAESQLAGLPDSARAAARASAQSKGKEGWRFTLQAPSALPVLRFLDDRSIREKVSRAMSTVATTGALDNSPIIARLLTLRAEKAKLLGYANYADFQTENRMAKSGANVKKFLGELEDKSRPFFDKENAELQAFRRSLEGPNAPVIEPWDISYYAEKLQNKMLSFDEEKLRPYLPLDSVVNGMFALVNRIYGITVKPVENTAVWAKGVTYYQISDADGATLGFFYADFHPRENKRAGAWMSPIRLGDPLPGGKMGPHLGLIACNLTPPVDGKPALLTHREVETVFHEFGHLLHLTLTNSPVKSLGGTSVAWDFVELPSQIMENFTWERPVLNLFAKHYQTGELLPDSLLGPLNQSRTFRAGAANMRQLGLGMTDILLHTDYTGDDKQGTPTQYSRQVMQRYSAAKLPDDFSMVTSFSHIFAGGYAAGYYSYKWSEVLDADAFTIFKQKGVFSREAGEKFRRTVLERGNTAEAGDLWRQLMGREPDVKPMLQRSGLDVKQGSK